MSYSFTSSTAKTGAAIYNPVNTVLGPESSSFKGQTLKLSPKVNVDYVQYNEKAQSFIDKYKLTNVVAYLDVTM